MQPLINPMGWLLSHTVRRSRGENAKIEWKERRLESPRDLCAIFDGRRHQIHPIQSVRASVQPAFLERTKSVCRTKRVRLAGLCPQRRQRLTAPLEGNLWDRQTLLLAARAWVKFRRYFHGENDHLSSWHDDAREPLHRIFFKPWSWRTAASPHLEG